MFFTPTITNIDAPGAPGSEGAAGDAEEPAAEAEEPAGKAEEPAMEDTAAPAPTSPSADVEAVAAAPSSPDSEEATAEAEEPPAEEAATPEPAAVQEEVLAATGEYVADIAAPEVRSVSVPSTTQHSSSKYADIGHDETTASRNVATSDNELTKAEQHQASITMATPCVHANTDACCSGVGAVQGH